MPRANSDKIGRFVYRKIRSKQHVGLQIAKFGGNYEPQGFIHHVIGLYF